MRQIELFKFWQNTRGVKIEAGRYDEDDPRLHGFGEMLVTNGHAGWVVFEDIEAPDPDPVELFKDEPVTFTSGALELLAEWGISQDEAASYFENVGIARVTKADAQDYIDTVVNQ